MPEVNGKLLLAVGVFIIMLIGWLKNRACFVEEVNLRKADKEILKSYSKFIRQDLDAELDEFENAFREIESSQAQDKANKIAALHNELKLRIASRAKQLSGMAANSDIAEDIDVAAMDNRTRRESPDAKERFLADLSNLANMFEIFYSQHRLEKLYEED